MPWPSSAAELVGAALALLLARNARIAAGADPVARAEGRQLRPGAADPYDLRVSAVSPANRAMLSELGAWQGIDASRVANYERMVVWQEATPPDSPDVLRFDAAELGEPDLGSIVENRALQAALLARCAEEGVQLRQRAGRRAFRIDADARHADAGKQCCHARTGGGRGWRRFRGAGGCRHQRAGTCLWAAGPSLPRCAVSVHMQHTAWQRFLATGPLALLPLASGDCSIVWSVVDAQAACPACP